MWTHIYEERTDLRRDELWPVLADVARWPEIDCNIEYIEIEGEPAPGTPFTLKVRGGPRLQFTIGEYRPPQCYSDICRLPLAEMRTRHSLIPAPWGTIIRIDIEVEGPLAPLWGRLVGRKHASGLPAQTERFIGSARVRAGHA